MNIDPKLNNNILLTRMEKDILDFLAKHDPYFVDKRWLNIGVTHLEQAFMAFRRSLFEGKTTLDD